MALPRQVAQPEIFACYSNSDLYVVSSRTETANVAMPQAMACGAPVVITSCGAPETLIDGTVGITGAPDDPSAMAKGVF